MNDQSKDSEGSRETKVVRVTQGKSVTLSESPLEKGFQPSKPANLAQPDNLPIPPPPVEMSQTKPTASIESQTEGKSKK